MPQGPTSANTALNPDNSYAPQRLDVFGNLKTVVGASEYETVAAGVTAQALGATGAVGDLLSSITYVPATTAAGVVQIKDGSDAAITLFVGGGTTALINLQPVTIPLNLVSRTGAWQVTTGANVSVIATGNFT